MPTKPAELLDRGLPPAPVRIGCVKYLNTLPLVEGLGANAGLRLRGAAPAELGGMLGRGEIDVGLVSLVDYASSAVPLALMSCGGIGCDGATLTVRVFSRVPAGQIRELHADIESHTSVVLAQVVLARAFGNRVKVVGFDACAHGGEWPEAVLLIGDKVVSDAPPGEVYGYELDLGEQWKALTGLPFVYAAWMCRGEDAGAEWVREVGRLLERQRLRNTMRTGWLIDKAVQEHRWPRELAVRYVTEYLRYEIGAGQREGIARFFAEGVALGLLPGREMVWVE